MNRTERITTAAAALIAVFLLVVTTALAASGPGKGGSGGSTTDDTTTEETTSTGTTTVTVTVTTPAPSPPTPVTPPQLPPKVTRRPCGSRSRMTLTLRPTARTIGVSVEVVARQRSEARRAERWRLVVFHERRITRRTWAVAKPVTGWFQAKLSVANWEGADAITTRAVSPGGETCSATLVV